MAFNFDKLKADFGALLDDAASHEPAIDAAVGTALELAGAPPEVSQVVSGLVNSLLGHFTADQAAAAAVAQPAEEQPQG